MGLLKPLFIASLFPDMVDKTIGYLLHLMPNGRHYSHNLFSLIGFSLLVTCLWGRPTGYAWFAGYLGHLLADGDSLVPWFFPLKKYAFKRGRLRFKRRQLLRETSLLLIVLITYRISR